MAYEPKRIKPLDKNNSFLRAWLWLWPINPHRLNTCYLFWGTVTAPVNFLFRILAAPFYFGLRRPVAGIAHRLDERPPTPREKRVAREKKWEGRLHAIGSFFNRFFLNPIGSIWRVGRWQLAGIGVLLVLFGLYLVGRSMPGWNWADLGTIVAFSVCLVLVWGGAIYLCAETRLGSMFVAFGHALKAGYWSVKNRTCTKYEVV